MCVCVLSSSPARWPCSGQVAMLLRCCPAQLAVRIAVRIAPCCVQVGADVRASNPYATLKDEDLDMQVIPAL